jgi:hypothetical protein
METGKTTKYFKYAIGEIILVVIGILIALQINNWNEKRKIENEIKSKIEALEFNLKNEIEVSRIQFHPEKINTIQKLLDGQLTLDSLKTKPNYADLFSQLDIRLKDDILEETIDALIENEDRLPKRYKVIVGFMKSLKFYFSNYKKSVQEIKQLLRENEKVIESNYNWYALQDSVSNEKRFQYYLTDPLYKNRLFTIQQKYRNAYIDYAVVIVTKLQILCAIKKIDDNYSPDDFRKYLSSIKFMLDTKSFINEAKKVSCNQETAPIVRSAHLLLNTSRDTVHISLSNGLKRIIPPHYSNNVLNRENDNIIRIYRNNACEAYEVSPLSFIIIE